ncbi:MAG TPA: glycoside hydrolase family 2 TIM barrel-domain containing protein [Solirubrobacteraceae bacterium]|nr:glycoside hydrolase family 2 TIM barrel-domain containing protein [Solirubrobacteraceae bacterium]
MSKGVPGKRAIVGLAALLALAIAAPTSSAGLDGPNGHAGHAGQAQRNGPGGRASQAQRNGPNGRASQVELDEGPGGRVALADWTLRRDPEDVGQLRGWPTGDFGGTPVSVPDVVNPAPIKGKRAVPDFEGSVAWYRTTLTAPTAGTYALEFASANYLVEVWIDGHSLGSHVGFYLPFEFRDALAAGTYTLVVRVDWRDPLLQTNEGFNRAWFNFGGLDGAVSVRELTASELSDPTIQTTLTPDAPTATQATVQLGVAVHNNGPARMLAPEGTLSRPGQTIPVTFAPQLVGAEQTVTMTATVTVATPALWAPGSPNLYELVLGIPGESSYAAHVGLRQLTWGGGKMYLNGQPLTLHGASLQFEAPGHGDALGPAEEDTLVQELQAIGANAARTQHPLPATMLERLDAAGILVWQGVGPVDPSGDWTGITPLLAERAREDVRTTVQADALHPSIIAWNLTNELAGNGHPGGQAQYVEAMSAWLHAYDPGRMVAVDVWGEHPPRHGAGPLYRDVDAVSETDYSGWYEGLREKPAKLRRLIDSRLAAMNATFAGKVQIISEFGAEGNALNRPGRPGSYAFQTRLLTQHIRLYEADPALSGMLVWVLRDFALNPTYYGGSVLAEDRHIKLIEGILGKGLFDYAGRPKPAERAVARLFEALPAV